MDLPRLSVGTTAAVQVAPLLGMDGRVVQSVMIKERFAIVPGRCTRAGGATIELADVPWDDASKERGSSKVPADLCLYKPGTDVIFSGHVVVPPGTALPHFDALLRVGPVERVLRVFGPRVWERTITRDLVPSRPLEAVRTTPLRWEAAFGGYDASVEGRVPAEEPRNPIGIGVVQDTAVLPGTPTHSIEDPRLPFESHRRPPPPAGVAAIGRHFEPRRSYAGTYDEAWQNERMPLAPLDFDARHDQCAHPELVVPGHLRGGEQVDLLHLTARGAESFALPSLRFFVGAHVDGSLIAARVVLDTILIDGDAATVDLTWRAAVPTPRPHHRLRFIQVNEQRVA